MVLNIFLSLSFVDAAFVRAVASRLPKGVARFYERSFERGEDLLKAMEDGLDASHIFVLFASNESLSSYAVNFEIDEARYRAVEGKIKKILVFPIAPDVTFASLPAWLKRSWVPNAGESPADIARYLTTIFWSPIEASLLQLLKWSEEVLRLILRKGPPRNTFNVIGQVRKRLFSQG